MPRWLWAEMASAVEPQPAAERLDGQGGHHRVAAGAAVFFGHFQAQQAERAHFMYGGPVEFAAFVRVAGQGGNFIGHKLLHDVAKLTVFFG